MDDHTARQHLTEVRAWAQAKIASNAEPPWAWFQYMKLVENADTILSGMSATTTESSPQPDSSQGAHLRLVDSTYPQDSAPPRPSGLPTQMPM